MKRKVITTITSIAILLSLFSVNASVVQAESLSGGQLLKQYIMENSIVEETTVSTELTAEDEASINASYIQSYIESNETAKQSYGGCYIDDNGKLHVLFTENVANSVVNSVNTMTENNTIYETCEYTLDELTALKEYISNIIISNITTAESTKVIDDIVAVGIYEKRNKVFVRIKDCTEEKIETLKKLLSETNAILFEGSDGFKRCVSTLNCGSGIVIRSSPTWGGYSIGFRCKSLQPTGEYAYGFMTAAHGNTSGDYVYNRYNDICIGYIGKRHYGNNGKVDCAFVCITNSDYEMSNTIQAGGGTLVSGAYATTYTEGNTAYMAGAVTTRTSGKILSSSIDTFGTTDDPIAVKDCVLVDCFLDEGDSGGLTYIKQNGSNYIAGINMAESYNDNDVEDGALFVKMSNIKNVSNIIVY